MRSIMQDVNPLKILEDALFERPEELEVLQKFVTEVKDGVPILRSVCQKIAAMPQNDKRDNDRRDKVRDLWITQLALSKNAEGFKELLSLEFRDILIHGHSRSTIMESPWYRGVPEFLSPLKMVYIQGLEDPFKDLIDIQLNQFQYHGDGITPKRWRIREIVKMVLTVLSRQDEKQPWKRMADRFFEHPDVKSVTLEMLEENLKDEKALSIRSQHDLSNLEFLFALELYGIYPEAIAGRIQRKIKHLTRNFYNWSEVLDKIPSRDFYSFEVKPYNGAPPRIQPWDGHYVGVYRYCKVLYDGLLGNRRSVMLENFKRDPIFALGIFDRVLFPFIDEVLDKIGRRDDPKNRCHRYNPKTICNRHFWISMFRDATSPFSRFPNELKTILMEYFLVHLSIDCEVDHCVRMYTTQFAKQCIERYPNANARIQALGYTGICFKESDLRSAGVKIRRL